MVDSYLLYVFCYCDFKYINLIIDSETENLSSVPKAIILVFSLQFYALNHYAALLLKTVVFLCLMTLHPLGKKENKQVKNK